MIETHDPRPITLTALREIDPAITIEDAVIIQLLHIPGLIPQEEDTEEERADPDYVPLPPGWQYSMSAVFLADVLGTTERAVRDAITRLMRKGVVAPVPVAAGYQEYRLDHGALSQAKALAVVRWRIAARRALDLWAERNEWYSHHDEW